MRTPATKGRSKLGFGLAAVAVGFPLLAATAGTGSAWASETISYSYDGRGRLVQVTHSGTVNDGVSTSYTHDKADNRTNKATTGAP